MVNVAAIHGGQAGTRVGVGNTEYLLRGGNRDRNETCSEALTGQGRQVDAVLVPGMTKISV